MTRLLILQAKAQGLIGCRLIESHLPLQDLHRATCHFKTHYIELTQRPMAQFQACR